METFFYFCIFAEQDFAKVASIFFLDKGNDYADEDLIFSSFHSCTVKKKEFYKFLEANNVSRVNNDRMCIY